MITGIKHNRTICAKKIMRDGEKLEQQGHQSFSWESVEQYKPNAFFFQFCVNFWEA